MTDNSDNNIEFHQREKDAEMATMKFEVKKFQLYPEDIEKMKTMSRDEKAKYMKKIREEERYIEVTE